MKMLGLAFVAILSAASVAGAAPSPLHVAASVPVGKHAAGLTATTGLLWVTNDVDNTVTPIDLATGEAGSPIHLGGRGFPDPSAAISGGGSVWVVAKTTGTISRIDPGTSKVTATLTVPAIALDLALANGSLWVTSFNPYRCSGNRLLFAADADRRTFRRGHWTLHGRLRIGDRRGVRLVVDRRPSRSDALRSTHAEDRRPDQREARKRGNVRRAGARRRRIRIRLGLAAIARHGDVRRPENEQDRRSNPVSPRVDTRHIRRRRGLALGARPQEDLPRRSENEPHHDFDCGRQAPRQRLPRASKPRRRRERALGDGRRRRHGRPDRHPVDTSALQRTAQDGRRAARALVSRSTSPSSKQPATVFCRHPG